MCIDTVHILPYTFAMSKSGSLRAAKEDAVKFYIENIKGGWYIIAEGPGGERQFVGQYSTLADAKSGLLALWASKRTQ